MTPRLQIRRRCILCGAEGLTRAHIYGRTLRAEFGQEAGSHHTLTNVDGGPEATVDRWGSGVGMIFSQSKSLCAECNNVWMGKPEDRALPVLATLVRGEPVEMNAETAEAVASWAVVATILRAQLVPDGAPYSPDAAARFRASGVDEAEASVWLVSVTEDHTLRGPGTSASTYRRHPELSGLIGLHWLKQVCVVVASEEHREVVSRGIGTLRNAMIRLHPEPQLQRWPSGRSAPDRVLLAASGWREDAAGASSAFEVSSRPPAGRTRTVLPL